MLPTVLIAISAFIATNTDDLLLLIGFFSQGSYRPTPVVIGQYIGIGTLTLVSVGCAFLSLTIAPAYVGFLGVLPLLIGIKKFLDIPENGEPAVLPKGISGASILSVSLVSIASGGDNISVYTPLFAASTKGQILATVALFAVMTALWCAVGYWLATHKKFGVLVRYWGERLLPWLLMLFGVYILWHAGSFTLLQNV